MQYKNTNKIEEYVLRLQLSNAALPSQADGGAACPVAMKYRQGEKKAAIATL